MIKTKSIKKFVAVLANVSLLLNSFVPFLLAVKPVYAEDEVIPTPTPTEIIIQEPTPTEVPTIIEVTPILEPTVEPTITPEVTVTPETTPTPEIIITPEVTPIVEPTITPEVITTPITETQNPDNNSNNSSISEVIPTVSSSTCESTPVIPQFSKQWTFEKVELNKEYVAPQNSEVKITFTKLPENSGNINIEEITLTPEQIEQTGSLSNKAYDITSDMPNGSFTYNLSLPIPIPSKGSNVDVKFSEEISGLNSAQKVENVVSKTDTSVSVNSLNHFTIFFVSATLFSTATLDEQLKVSVYPNESIKATLKVGLNWSSAWKYSEWKIGNGIDNKVMTGYSLFNTSSFSEKKYLLHSFDITAPSTPGTYDVSFKVCPFNELLNDCETKILKDGITVVAIPVCEYTYSEWSTCDSSNTQTRTVTATPNDCQGTPDLTIKPCVYDNVSPTADISYNTTNPTNQPVVATLINPSESITVTNNSGLLTYTFNENGAFTFEFVDSVGNTGSATATVNNIDKTPPTISNKTDFGSTWYKTNQTSNFEYFDINGIASGTPVSCSISTEGANQVCSVMPNVCDSVGNCNTETAISNGANFDKRNPNITASVNPATPDAQNGWYKTQPEITVEASDDNFSRIEYQWDSEPVSFVTNNFSSFKPTTEGIHTLYFKAIDLAGNTAEGSQQVKWDQTDPELGPQNISADPNPTSGSTSKIKWEAAKDNNGIDKYEIQWNLNDSNPSISYSKTVGYDVFEVEVDQLTEGRWTVKVIAFDKSGRSKNNSIDLNVDRTAPSAPILKIDNTETGTVSLSWNAIDDAKDYIIWYGSVQGNHNFGARVGNVTSYTVKGLGAGNYYFIIKAIDAAQNQSVDSNEVNTGTIIGATGTTPGQPAEGFSPEVKGVNIQTTPGILGVIKEKLFNWWWLLLIFPIYSIGRRIIKKKK